MMSLLTIQAIDRYYTLKERIETLSEEEEREIDELHEALTNLVQ